MLTKSDVALESIGIGSIEFLNGFNVRIMFTDMTRREIDLEPFLRGPIFEPIRNNLELFRQAAIDPEWQCLVWPNGADIDPDALYFDGPPPWAESNPDGSPITHESVIE